MIRKLIFSAAKLIFSAATLALCLTSAPAFAQNTTPPAAVDLVLLSRQPSPGTSPSGDSIRGAVSVSTLFNASGVGYSTGGGGAVTQITSRTTGVTLNKLTGAITLVSAAGSATAASFTVTNSQVGANDVIVLNQKTGTNLYELFVTAVAAGSFQVTVFTTGGTTTETPIISFAVVKGAVS